MGQDGLRALWGHVQELVTRVFGVQGWSLSWEVNLVGALGFFVHLSVLQQNGAVGVCPGLLGLGVLPGALVALQIPSGCSA